MEFTKSALNPGSVVPAEAMLTVAVVLLGMTPPLMPLRFTVKFSRPLKAAVVVMGMVIGLGALSPSAQEMVPLLAV